MTCHKYEHTPTHAPTTHTLTHTQDYLRHVCVWRSSLWPEEAAAVRPGRPHTEKNAIWPLFLDRAARLALPPVSHRTAFSTNPVEVSLKPCLRLTDRWTLHPQRTRSPGIPLRPTTESVLDSNERLSLQKKDSSIKETHEATWSHQRVNMVV